jgi:hypothetical protein
LAFRATVAWRRRDLAHGLGVVKVVGSSGKGFVAHGLETCVGDGRIWSVLFALEVSPSWETHRFFALVYSEAGDDKVSLEADRAEGWTRDDNPAPELDGCTDVDIVSTPFTNTLPIRRLRLAVGESADIRAAWVDVPSLEVSVSNQRYTRLEPANGVDRYEFVELDSGDAYQLTVDEDGLVIDYENFAERVAPPRER